MVKKIVLVKRYTAKCETPEEIKEFNDFYDLEEARLNYEFKMQREWAITDFMEKNF